jgi:hypothetical protein
LVLTFINTLRNDLEEQLHDLADVSTLHSYCLRSARYCTPSASQANPDSLPYFSLGSTIPGLIEPRSTRSIGRSHKVL